MVNSKVLAKVFEFYFVCTFLFFLNTGNHIVKDSWYLCCAAAASVDCNACLLQPGDVLGIVRARYDGPEGDLHKAPHLLASEERKTATLSPRRKTNNFSNCL